MTVVVFRKLTFWGFSHTLVSVLISSHVLLEECLQSKA